MNKYSRETTRKHETLLPHTNIPSPESEPSTCNGNTKHSTPKQSQSRITNIMSSHKTQCPWCNSVYSQARAYSNHIQQKHLGQDDRMRTPLKRRAPDVPHTHHVSPNSPVEVYFDELQGDLRPEPLTNSDFESVEVDLAEIYNLFPDMEPIVEYINDPTSENASDVESDKFHNRPDATPYTVDHTQHLPKRYQAARVISHIPFSQRHAGYNYLQLFHNPRDYKLARFLTLSKIPKMRINEFFQDNLMPDVRLSFKSGHTFYKQTTLMIDDPEWTTGMVQYPLRPQSEFRYCNIIECIQYLLWQRAFVKHML